VPKKYKYHVVLESHIGTASAFDSIDIELDHQFSGTDAKSIEKSKNHFFTTCGIINVIPNGVTGDFTYNVVYQTKEFGVWITKSTIYTQDHKHTSKTVRADFKEFIRFLFPSNSAVAPINWSSELTKILLFIEIPEE